MSPSSILRSGQAIQLLDIPPHLLSADIHEVVNFLLESHKRYEYSVIPRIEQQFVGLLKLYPEAPEMRALFNLFQKFQMEMQWHMSQEEESLYPKVLDGSIGSKKGLISHEDQEPFLFEVIQLLKKTRYADTPFCRMLIGNLELFEKDLRLHAWVEEHLLV